jgi:hypothetical protein
MDDFAAQGPALMRQAINEGWSVPLFVKDTHFIWVSFRASDRALETKINALSAKQTRWQKFVCLFQTCESYKHQVERNQLEPVLAWLAQTMFQADPYDNDSPLIANTFEFYTVEFRGL